MNKASWSGCAPTSEYSSSDEMEELLADARPGRALSSFLCLVFLLSDFPTKEDDDDTTLP